MNNYVTGAAIRRLREGKGMTQEALAEALYVSAKAVSKWETGKGFPDISLLEPLARALDISVIELLSGNDIRNRNRAANMARAVWYACPVCGKPMIRRTIKRGTRAGQQFWGCSGYPECQGTLRD